ADIQMQALVQTTIRSHMKGMMNTNQMSNNQQTEYNTGTSESNTNHNLTFPLIPDESETFTNIREKIALAIHN
ncbi:1174_t:CDS:1, partial [Gigaspora rosea]